MGRRSDANAWRSERVPREDASFDWVDVPAAVVCAACGDPNCAGCAVEEPNASGVIAIVPWERPGLGLFRRLWQTSLLATSHSKTFFGALPEGEVSSALAFALICEAVAVAGLGLGASLLSLGFLPQLPRLLLEDPSLRRSVLRATSFGGLLLILAMVSVHVVHGLALDFTARHHGSRKRGRGLRFGLYACGWDLITLPLGLFMVALIEGFAAARRALPLGLTAPPQSAEAYLVGFHGLPADIARSAARRAARFTAVPLLILLAAAALLVALSR